MADVLSIDELELPGAGYDFHDVTSLFVEAGVELEPNSLIFMDNFTLQESMSALEIGEPRLDSGLIVREQLRPPFNPLAPLLPEELCWILDRALAYETEFHAGNFLAHTVHTLLYIHHLREIDPDVLVSPSTMGNDPSRPIELVTIVLRSAVQGLLKCCDLTWRELARGGAYDTEDWQSDKCEVSLLEGLPVAFALSKLDEAADWLSRSTVPTIWKTALRARLHLRKTMLQIMSTDPTKDRYEFQNLVFMAKDHLHTVQANPPLDQGPETLAHLAFDPYIGRRLQMATPIRIVPPPSFQDTCKTLNHFLDGLYEIGLLETVDQLTTWETVGNLRLWLPGPLIPVPYLRSLTQSTFYDGVLILNKYPFEWMINSFFSETVGVNYDSIKASVALRWVGPEPEPPFRKVERSLYKLITPHIRAQWSNPPRRRRHFMKALLEWHALYDSLAQIRDNIDLEDLPRGHLLAKLPDTVLLWRLSIVREIVLSGFQLELYSDEERSFAYWYAAQVIDIHLHCLDGLFPVVAKDSPVHREMLYQVQFLTALQSLCTALFIISMPLMSFDWTRIRPNFFRRYKWAFRAEYDIFESPVVAQPELHEFIRACGEILQFRQLSIMQRIPTGLTEYVQQNGNPVPVESIQLARTILVNLLESGNPGGWPGLWAKDRMQLIRKLVSVCENLAGLPATPEEMDAFNAKTLKWNPEFHPWFPSLLSANDVA
ncbi:hypothetical protein GALMADRAFT_221894 [Galerina marginata CBS 339.88]|uniref:Mak10 subunit, NatC N(Alpha)-terminal acetyltransferase n=1 Tax=Galerina marginata (strain CBS 339.88) TaxID=685588 RepID=A0A067TFN7_GALM3|nr:hypothetical protein GALMADRAFT_221894 [Galerina marginata CBS 339.88]